MENSQADNPSNEFEIVEMFRIDTRMRVDLKGIVVMGRVLKQAVERVEHFMREQEEELSKDTQLERDKENNNGVSKQTPTACCSTELTENHKWQVTWKGHHNRDHLHLQT
jgi:hypothetical protein